MEGPLSMVVTALLALIGSLSELVTHHRWSVRQILPLTRRSRARLGHRAHRRARDGFRLALRTNITATAFMVLAKRVTRFLDSPACRRRAVPQVVRRDRRRTIRRTLNVPAIEFRPTRARPMAKTIGK